MKPAITTVLLGGLIALQAGAAVVGLMPATARAATLKVLTACPGTDAVLVGSTCVDKYEASVWQIPPTATSLINKVKKGTATCTDLTGLSNCTGPGPATLISPSSSCTPAFPGTFPANGQWTAPLYAVSIPGVHPTACVTWFQAEQACRLSSKRLPTSQEWQAAVAGTPDTGGSDNGLTTCNTDNLAPGLTATGSRTACVSNWGTFDMVGNVNEWVADWVPVSTQVAGNNPALCKGWGTFSNNAMCLSGADTTVFGPGALIRGGSSAGNTFSGPLCVSGVAPPSVATSNLGFRCAR